MAPQAEDRSMVTMLPPSRRIVRDVSDIEGAAIALRAQTPETPAASMIQVRRSQPVSTTGEYRKYQTFGIEEIAITFAMRSGVTPCLRRRKGISTTMTPLNAPYGMDRIPNSQAGLCAELSGSFGRAEFTSCVNPCSPREGTCEPCNRTTLSSGHPAGRVTRRPSCIPIHL